MWLFWSEVTSILKWEAIESTCFWTLTDWLFNCRQRIKCSFEARSFKLQQQAKKPTRLCRTTQLWTFFVFSSPEREQELNLARSFRAQLQTSKKWNSYEYEKVCSSETGQKRSKGLSSQDKTTQNRQTGTIHVLDGKELAVSQHFWVKSHMKLWLCKGFGLRKIASSKPEIAIFWYL